MNTTEAPSDPEARRAVFPQPNLSDTGARTGEAPQLELLYMLPTRAYSNSTPSKRQCARTFNIPDIDISVLKAQITEISAKLESTTKVAEELEKKQEARFAQIEQKAVQDTPN